MTRGSLSVFSPVVARLDPTICTHLQPALLRRVSLSESMMLRRHSGAEMEGSLGRFGDRRLEKGGPACWLGWFVWANRASACAAWVAIAQARCVLAGSCVTGGGGPVRWSRPPPRAPLV